MPWLPVTVIRPVERAAPADLEAVADLVGRTGLADKGEIEVVARSPAAQSMILSVPLMASASSSLVMASESVPLSALPSSTARRRRRKRRRPRDFMSTAPRPNILPSTVSAAKGGWVQFVVAGRHNIGMAGKQQVPARVPRVAKRLSTG